MQKEESRLNMAGRLKQTMRGDREGKQERSGHQETGISEPS